MSKQKGITLVELLVVVAMAALVLAAVAAYALPWLGRETMRSAIYDVQTHVQLARIEAVSRNRQCSFVVNTVTRELRVFDMMGTVNPADDRLLYEGRLPESIDFSRPEGGAAVTLFDAGGGDFATVFNPDGTVAAGVGDVVLLGGERFGRVAVFGAGGTQVTRWINGAWHVGS